MRSRPPRFSSTACDVCVCAQTHVAALPSMDALLGRHVDLAAVRKIGEGTFGEAFRAGRASICFPQFSHSSVRVEYYVISVACLAYAQGKD